MKFRFDKKEIQAEITKMNQLEQYLEKTILKFPNGTLRCAKKGGTFQYYCGKEYLDSSKKAWIEQIANREYQECLLKKVKEKRRALYNLRRLAGFDFEQPENLYEQLHPARQTIVKPILKSKKMIISEWELQKYDKWEITDDDVRGKFYTVKNERVRSKSEKIIADELARYGIPYRYEYPLSLRDGNKIVTKRPDFIALNVRTLEEVIIEHLGLLDREKYFNENMDKIGLYESNGYLIGRNLLLLHETSGVPLNTKILDQYIEEYLM